jgi:hypothetical protein
LSSTTSTLGLLEMCFLRAFATGFAASTRSEPLHSSPRTRTFGGNSATRSSRRHLQPIMARSSPKIVAGTFLLRDIFGTLSNVQVLCHEVLQELATPGSTIARSRDVRRDDGAPAVLAGVKTLQDLVCAPTRQVLKGLQDVPATPVGWKRVVRGAKPPPAPSRTPKGLRQRSIRRDQERAVAAAAAAAVLPPASPSKEPPAAPVVVSPDSGLSAPCALFAPRAPPPPAPLFKKLQTAAELNALKWPLTAALHVANFKDHNAYISAMKSALGEKRAMGKRDEAIARAAVEVRTREDMLLVATALVGDAGRALVAEAERGARQVLQLRRLRLRLRRSVQGKCALQKRRRKLGVDKRLSQRRRCCRWCRLRLFALALCQLVSSCPLAWTALGKGVVLHNAAIARARAIAVSSRPTGSAVHQSAGTGERMARLQDGGRGRCCCGACAVRQLPQGSCCL